MTEWKLEDQLNDQEIDEIIDNEISAAKQLVHQKEQEAEIYINYLRTEADRLENQLELLRTRLRQKEDAEFIDRVNALSKGKTVKANRNRMRKIRSLSGGRQHLIKKH